jgi:hypothetical protein
MSTSPPNVKFRRDLIRPWLLAWNTLLHHLVSVQLSPGTDEFKWNLHANVSFSVDSMYEALILPKVPVDSNKVHRGVTLIKYNLVRQNWQGSKRCVFYHEYETIKYFCFHC